jgi:hypothetical protein
VSVLSYVKSLLATLGSIADGSAAALSIILNNT